ncbi:hypothetical protein [Amycolatopsis sp. NPDC003676]
MSASGRGALHRAHPGVGEFGEQRLVFGARPVDADRETPLRQRPASDRSLRDRSVGDPDVGGSERVEPLEKGLFERKKLQVPGALAERDRDVGVDDARAGPHRGREDERLAPPSGPIPLSCNRARPAIVAA